MPIGSSASLASVATIANAEKGEAPQLTKSAFASQINGTGATVAGAVLSRGVLMQPRRRRQRVVGPTLGNRIDAPR